MIQQHMLGLMVKVGSLRGSLVQIDQGLLVLMMMTMDQQSTIHLSSVLIKVL